jgi:hypothetical protein
MNLDLDDAAWASDLAIADVRCVCVSYLRTKRTAWHDTRSYRYTSTDSFHSDFDSARMAAENQRKQGTVFQITEILAIAIDTEIASFVVAHQNAQYGEAFRNWAVALPANSSIGSARLYDIQAWTKLGALLAALARDSGHWRTQPAEHERVLTFYDVDRECTTMPERPLSWFESQAAGHEAPLQWIRYGEVERPTATTHRVAELRQRLRLPMSSAVTQRVRPT